MLPNLALVGKARSGKDTLAAHLCEAHGYTRLAFADPLKEMALDINPYIPTGYGVTARLTPLIADVGWEYAKDNYPEVRRLLQRVGQTVRGYDSDFWLRALVAKIGDGPTVVTDVRYPNELVALRFKGFRSVRIIRPGLAGLPAGASAHESETSLDQMPTLYALYNGGTIADLTSRADRLIRV